MRENIRKLEDPSYRYIFKIINISKKRKHRKWTKIIQENFPRTERHEFPDEKDSSRCPVQWIHSKTYIQEISEQL